MDDEALRARSRAREENRRELKAAKLRRTAFVLRHASRAPGRANWRPAPRRWLSEVVWPTPAPQSVLQADVQTVTEPSERLGRLALARPAQVQTWRFAPVVDALQALRGVPCTVAVTPVAALGALTRFATPRQLRPSLGRTPAA